MHFSKAGLRFDGSIFNDALAPNPSLAKAKQTLEIPLFWIEGHVGKLAARRNQDVRWTGHEVKPGNALT